jgi:hypothetical protein
MDSKDFFGAPDPGEELAKPSVLSVVVDKCSSDFTDAGYQALPSGKFAVESDGHFVILTEEQMQEDVCSWIRMLDSDSPLGDKIVALVRTNSGWQKIIARRVLKALRIDVLTD